MPLATSRVVEGNAFDYPVRYRVMDAAAFGHPGRYRVMDAAGGI